MALHSPADVEAMIKVTGGETVTYGGATTYGHFEHQPAEVFAGDGRGVITVGPRVVIADCRLPDIGTDPDSGTVSGVGEDIVVDDVAWTISDVLPGESPGEIMLELTNPRSGD